MKNLLDDAATKLWFMLQYLLSFFLDHLMNYPAEGTFGQRNRNVAGVMVQSGQTWFRFMPVAVHFPAENGVVNVTLRYLTHV